MGKPVEVRRGPAAVTPEEGLTVTAQEGGKTFRGMWGSQKTCLCTKATAPW